MSAPDLQGLNAQVAIVDAQGRPTIQLQRIIAAVVKAVKALQDDTTDADAITAINSILAANGIDLDSDHEGRIATLEP